MRRKRSYSCYTCADTGKIGLSIFKTCPACNGTPNRSLLDPAVLKARRNQTSKAICAASETDLSSSTIGISDSDE